MTEHRPYPHVHFRERVRERLPESICPQDLWSHIKEAVIDQTEDAVYLCRLCKRTSRRLWMVTYPRLTAPVFVVFHHDEQVPLTVLTVNEPIVRNKEGGCVDLRDYV